MGSGVGVSRGNDGIGSGGREGVVQGVEVEELRGGELANLR